MHPRKKGTGSDDAWLPLLPQAAAALRLFFRAKAEGPFQVAALYRVFRRAVRRAQRTLRRAKRHEDAARLESMRLYDLRHSFLTALATAAPDIYAVAEYAGHRTLQTTRRYMKGAAQARMQSLIAAAAPTMPVPWIRATGSPQKRRRKPADGKRLEKTRTPKR